MDRSRRFEQETAVRRVGDDRYRGDVSGRWLAAAGTEAANGGYLVAMAGRAMQAATGLPDPVTVTAHFLRPAHTGPVDVSTNIVRRGRRHTNVAGTLTQDGQPCISLLAVFSDLSMADGAQWDPRPACPVPPFETCRDVNAEAAKGRLPLNHPSLQRFDVRMPEDSLAWLHGEASGMGRMEGWCRLASGERMDSLGLLTVVDDHPPAVLNAGLAVGWVPTIELTVHVRRRPTSTWLSFRYLSREVIDGYVESDGEVRDESGALVASSRQLALVRRPT